MQIKDLVVTGDARILGNLYTKDGSVGTGGGGGGDGGSGITYRLTKSGSTITLTGSDGSTSSVTDTDTNTTYTLSSLGAAPASHSHIEIVNDTVGIKASDSNEISFKSNANHIYFGYENRAGSSGIVDTYKFGTHSGVNNATKGIIECGRVVEDGTALTDKYAPKYQYSTSDLTAGSSSLATGVLYFVYE